MFDRTLVVVCFALFLVASPLTTSPAVAQIDDNYTLTMSSGEGDPGDVLELPVVLDFSGGDDIQGFQWSVCHDDEALTLADGDIVNGAAIESLSFTFLSVGVITDPGAAGFSCGALLNVITGEVISPSDDNEVLVCSYTINSDTDTPETTIEWCGNLGTPMVTNRVIVMSDEVEPATVDGTVIALGVGGGAIEFINGDANDDGVVNNLDGFFLISSQFLGGDPPNCELAADADDSGAIDTGDILFILEFVFLEGVSPAAPFPDCGVSTGALDCVLQDSCT